MKKKRILGLLLVLLLSLPVFAKEQSLIPPMGVFYQIFVRSFADSSGDGLGDLRGIRDRLDYLNDGDPTSTSSLSVTGLWLTPIHPSPTYHKYDVIDYYAVCPEVGTLEDFKELITEANARGIRILLDLVVNHTSTQHPWFLDARSSPDSTYRDYYIWACETTNIEERGPWGQRVWHKAGDSYYYGLFWGEMPDLNLKNPKVRAEIKAIAQYWLEFGVDGFRIDAAKHIFEHDRSLDPVEWWVEFREFVHSIHPTAYLVGEVWDTSHAVAPFYAGFDSCFNFDLAALLLRTAQAGFDVGLVQVVLGHRERFLQHTFHPFVVDALFLSNHDQDRVMSVLTDWDRAKTASALYLTLPGNPFIYAGEEIGMKGMGPHEYIREPFRWYATEGEGQTSYRPQTFNGHLPDVSVEEMDLDPDSLLNHYRRLLQVRNTDPALRYGELVPVSNKNRRTIVFGRVYGDYRTLVLHNISNNEQEVQIDSREWALNEVLFEDKPYALEKDGEGIYTFTLSPRSLLMIRD